MHGGGTSGKRRESCFGRGEGRGVTEEEQWCGA